MQKRCRGVASYINHHFYIISTVFAYVFGMPYLHRFTSLMSFIFLWSLSVCRTKALLALLLTRDLCIHQVILPRYVHSIVKILYKLQKIYSDSIHFVAINQGEYPNFVTVLTLKQWVFKKNFSIWAWYVSIHFSFIWYYKQICILHLLGVLCFLRYQRWSNLTVLADTQ